MKEFYINSDGIRLHAKLDMPIGFPQDKSYQASEKTKITPEESKTTSGKCPLLILIHGFTGHMEERHILAVQQAANELGLATLRVEMYGHGMSDGKFEDHNLFKWINNALSVIDYAKSLDFVTDLYLSGHSQGGLLTILAAGLRPNDFKAIIPLSPALCIPVDARRGCLLGHHFDPENIPEIIDVWDDKILKGDYIHIAQMIYAEDLIKKYHGPVLLIHGDADGSVDVNFSIEADKLYENSRLVIIPGDSHCFDFHLDQMIDAFKEGLCEMMK